MASSPSVVVGSPSVSPASALGMKNPLTISTRRAASLGPLWWIGNPGLVAGPFRRVCARAEERGELHKWNWETMYRWLLTANPSRAEEYRLFIERERQSIPDFDFRRLYEAEWTEDEAAVFRGVGKCLDGNSLLAPGSDRFYLGVDGPITYKKNETLRAIFAAVPLDRILIETDAPYLTPQAKRGQRNEPAYVRLVAEKLAEVRGMTLEAMAQATTANAARFFGWA